MDRPQVLILGQDPNLVRPVRAALQNSLIVHLVHIHTEQASNPLLDHAYLEEFCACSSAKYTSSYFVALGLPASSAFSHADIGIDHMLA
jgi:hypothetical protein